MKNLSTRLEKIDKEFDKEFAYNDGGIDWEDPKTLKLLRPIDVLPFIHSVIQQEIKEAFKATTPEKMTQGFYHGDTVSGYEWNKCRKEIKQNQKEYLKRK